MPAAVPDLCILFLYHTIDELTRRHFDLVKRHNPDAIVVPVTDGMDEHLPGGVDLADTPSRWQPADKWAAIDVTLYRWFEHHRVEAQRYVVFEYDVCCNQPVADAYRHVWNADMACAHFMLPWKQPYWYWFEPRSLMKLTPRQRRFAAGVAPFAGTLFSRRGLEAIVQRVTTADVFCELRLGTAAREAGLTIQQFPRALSRTIQWHAINPDLSKPGIYHSIKPEAELAAAQFFANRRQRGWPRRARDISRRIPPVLAIWAGATLRAQLTRHN